MNIPLSVCIIAKNEEKYLRKCLEALSRLDCEIILADTGSSDSTPVIASEFTDKVFSIPWTDDFAAARNAAAAKASNDLILFVDCDEFLTDADLPALERAVREHPDDAGMITRLNPFCTYGESKVHHEHVARLYDRRKLLWQGRIHENIVPLEADRAITYFEVPLTFYHAGYQDEQILKKKAKRNLELLLSQLEEEGPDPYLCFQIGQSYNALNETSLAAEYYERGLSMDVDPRLAYVKDMLDAYGYALLDLKQYEKALGLEAVYDAFCGRADYLFLMGLIYMNNARFEDAIRAFQKATETSLFSVEGVNSYRAFYNMGVIYEVTGNTKEALVLYRNCDDYAPALKRLKALSE